MLEAEGYLGWKPEGFYEATVRSLISITVTNMAHKDTQQFYGKYGKNIDAITLRSTRVVDC